MAPIRSHRGSPFLLSVCVVHRADRTAGTGDTVRAAAADLAYPFLGQLFRLGTADPATVPIFIAIYRYIDGIAPSSSCGTRLGA